MKAFLRHLFLHNRLFQGVGIVSLFFIVSFVIDGYILLPKILFVILLSVLITDILILFRISRGIQASRDCAEKLSNGDDNEIRLAVSNFYPFKVTVTIIDEAPIQFQRRDTEILIPLDKGETNQVKYFLRPVERGEYHFGALHVYVRSPLGLVLRRYTFPLAQMLPVYPSYIQMRKYELLAISNRLVEAGIKKIRRIGHNQEFELIKEYVPGDDYRTINWKATARRLTLMVNHYQDERSQQVYSLIDKGRIMQMPFNGMSLLDYAINASLVISNIAIKKSDKAGLVTFQDKVGTTLMASNRNSQMNKILEVLYNQETDFRESDFSALYTHVRRKISQRSLLLLFTNFESIYGLQRQVQFIKNLSHQHLVVVIFFENTEVQEFITQPATDLRTVYQKTIAEKFSMEKRLIVRELARYGIQSLLTRPENLTVATINKYLELKARGMI